MTDRITKEFLQAIKESEHTLFSMQFVKDSFLEKGLAYYIQYRKNGIVLEIIFGPPEFQVEILLCTNTMKYAFKDLLQIPAISEWVIDNRYIQKYERNIKDEIQWFFKLVDFYLKTVDK